MSWQKTKCYLDLNWVSIGSAYPIIFPSIPLACGKEFVGKWASTKAIAFTEATEAEKLMHFSILYWVRWTMQKVPWPENMVECKSLLLLFCIYFREQHICLSVQNFQKVMKSLITAAWAVWSPWFRKVSINSSQPQPFAWIGTVYRLSLFR